MFFKKLLYMSAASLFILSRLSAAQEFREAEKLNVKSTKVIPKIITDPRVPVDLTYVGEQSIVVNEKRIAFFVTSLNKLAYFDDRDQPIFEKEFDRTAGFTVSNNSSHIFAWDKKRGKCWLETIEGNTLWERDIPKRLLRGPRVWWNYPQVTRNGEVILSLDGYVNNSSKYLSGPQQHLLQGKGERLEFYDAQGNVRAFGTLSRADVRYITPAWSAISPEGNYYAINCDRLGGGSTVAFYDLRDLRELWRHDFKTSGMAGLAVSPNGQYVVAVSGTNHAESGDRRSLHIFDKTGNSIAEIEDGAALGESMVLKAFSSEGNCSAILGKKAGIYHLYLVRVPTGELLWQYSASEMENKSKSSVFGLISVSKNAEYTTARYQASGGDILFLLNRNGNVVWQERVSYRAGSLVLSTDGRDLWHSDKKGNIYHYQFER